MEKVRSVLQGIVKRFLERQPEIEELSLREGDKILDALCTGLIREELLREGKLRCACYKSEKTSFVILKITFCKYIVITLQIL